MGKTSDFEKQLFFLGEAGLLASVGATARVLIPLVLSCSLLVSGGQVSGNIGEVLGSIFFPVAFWCFLSVCLGHIRTH